MRIFLTALAFCAICTAAQAAENPWATMAEGDLQAIHDTIEANHPGPVDPQNPGFRVWLENGLKKAMARAGTARSFGDYRRAVRFYTNGFEDGHISAWFTETPTGLSWPGFVVRATTADDAKVVYAEPGSDVAKGARLLSCDGKSLDTLMPERVDPYYWNAAIPHVRYNNIDHLFFQAMSDTQPPLKTCRFSSGDVKLNWRHEYDYNEDQLLKLSTGKSPAKLQIQKIDDVWLIGIPTFDFTSKTDIAKIQKLIGDIREKVSVLRHSTVVFDVRGNGGGNPDWGIKIAETVWGKAWVERVTGQIGGPGGAWRVSASNLEKKKENLRLFGPTMDKHERSNVQALIETMKRALKQHKPLAHFAEDAPPSPAPPPPNLVKGRAYLLTDNACASACLVFADIVLRLPNTIQVGLPTSADSVYADANYKQLPSGLAYLEYGMGIFRNGPRGNNEWYKPKYRWPGGPMNDDKAIVRWIESLH